MQNDPNLPAGRHSKRDQITSRHCQVFQAYTFLLSADFIVEIIYVCQPGKFFFPKIIALRQNIRTLYVKKHPENIFSDPVHRPPDPGWRSSHFLVMAEHNLSHFPNCIVVKLQAAQDLHRHLFPNDRMFFIMRDTFLVYCQRLWLPDIMKKHTQPQHLIRPHFQHGMQDMLSYAVAMMRIILRSLHAEIKFRKNLSRDSRLICDAQIVRMIRDKQFNQFRLNTLRTDFLKIRRQLSDSTLCILRNLVSQLCGKTNCSQHPQRILRKALLCIAHTADHSRLHIAYPIENIHQSCLLIISHRIHGKIPSPQVFFQTRRKSYLFRMPPILIHSINTVCGHLKSLMIHHHRHRTMLNPGIDSPCKNPFHVLRFRRCGNVPITGLSAQYRIANTAADGIRLISRRNQRFNDSMHFIRQLYFHHIPYPYPFIMQVQPMPGPLKISLTSSR